MALFHQRDARWLVQDRADGHNVNGWHWEERNRQAWTKERLEKLLGSGSELAANLDPALGYARITDLKDCSGEAYQTLRKGNKKFAVYDLHIKLSWNGTWLETDTKVTGAIEITEFCSTNDPDEYVISVTAEGSDAANSKLRAAVQDLQPAILERLAQYVAELNAL